MTAIAVTIAGSDSGGGAGIQADLKTFSAFGVYGASVLTALTAQNTLGVTAIHDVPPAFVRAEIDAVFSDLAIDAVKIGMLSRPEVIIAVADGLSAFGAERVVLDPVMVAASGDPLIAEDAVETLIARLLPLADLVTPNLPEAARLTGRAVADDEDDMIAQGEMLLGYGARAVLMKGGHGSGPRAVDILVRTGHPPERYSAPRIVSRNTHGTGCTLSSAIAAGLARGRRMPEAVRQAKAYLTGALATADSQHIGAGHGPGHHFFKGVIPFEA